MTKVFVSIFTILLLASFASATAVLTISNVNAPANVSHNSGSFPITFNLTNTGDTTESVSYSGSRVNSGTGTFTFPSTSIAPNQSIIVGATVTFPAQQAGSIAGLLNATASGSSVTYPFSVTILNSGSLSLSKISELTYNQNGTINITNTGNVALVAVLSSTSNLGITFSENNFVLPVGSSKAVIVRATQLGNLKFGDNTAEIKVLDSSTGATATTSFTLAKSFCSNGNVGVNLTVRKMDISTTGDKEKTWMLLDTITIDVEVKNENNNDELRDVEVELGLFNSAGTNFIGDMDFISKDDESTDLGDISDDERETATFEFQVPSDFDTGSYRLVAKAYSKDSGESLECEDISDSIDIKKETDSAKFISFSNIKLSPTEATCGDFVTLNINTVNVGDEDQNQIKVNLVNRDLKLNQFVELKQGLDQGEKKAIGFSFQVPQGLSDKTYQLELTSEYDYSKSSGSYREESEESFAIPLKVFGCTAQVPQRTALITASLASDAVAGKDMTVKASIKNLGNSTTSFVIDAKDYSSWSELKSISDRLVTLSAGDSKDVTMVFTLNEDASGENSFTIEARSSFDKAETREVSVNIQGTQSGFALPSFGGNGLIWVIGALNLLLVIIIIIVAIRISRR